MDKKANKKQCEKNTHKIVKNYCNLNFGMVICGRNENVENLHKIILTKKELFYEKHYESTYRR